MQDTTIVSVKKPISVFNREVKVDLKKLLIALTKSVLIGVIKADPISGAKELTDIFNAFDLKTDNSGAAYMLLLKAMVNAAHNLAKENTHLFNKDLQALSQLYDNPEYVKFLDEMNAVLEAKELSIDSETFKNPRSLSFLENFRIFFQKWLVVFGVEESAATTISHRLPAYFVMALNDEWRSNSSHYEPILKKTATPFTEAAKRELEWERYNSFLQQQIEQPVFDEPFGLRQIFIPLRAYYYQKENSIEEYAFINSQEKIDKKRRVPVWLEDELEEWLSTNDPSNCIRFLSGGPGSGKSSFAKIWAAHISNQQAIKVLFVPLHFFDIKGDLADSMEKFVKMNHDVKFSFNPLKEVDSKLLVIFDGLDELSQQGVGATEIASQFIRSLNTSNLYINRINSIKTLFLVTGRELAIQGNTNEFRLSNQILHLLPYKIQEDLFERLNEEQLRTISTDQRHEWWRKYGELKGKVYNKMPTDLDIKRLDEITTQPLLNYLVALSVERGKIVFSKNTNLNDIYRDLLEGVYERAYEKRQNANITILALQDFCRILEEIAISAWHGGDTRTTSVKQIERHIFRNKLKPLLDQFKTDAKSGIIRLLTAFYFREFGIQDGEQTFEFTHKSFGEYLTAVRLVKQVEKINYQLNERIKNYDNGWGEEQSLDSWLEIAGETVIDSYLFSFIKDEVARHSKDILKLWQKTLAHLLSNIINNGMPMEEKVRKSHKEEARLVRNSGEALLALHHACTERTQQHSEIKLYSDTALGDWILSLQPQRKDTNTVLAYECLTFLKLSNSCLNRQDLGNANLTNSVFLECTFINTLLKRANLKKAFLREAFLQEAFLQEANLQGANLQGANLQGANLQGANLQEAYLQGAYLQGAYLQGAYLQGANLQGTNLQGVYLQGAHLQGVYIQGVDLWKANLRDANVREANLREANLREANLQGADLQEADLQEADLKEADLKKTILVKANLRRADFQGADLRKVYLQGADLRGAILQEVDLQGANLQGANLQGANLQGAYLQGAILRQADLKDAELRESYLQGAYLQEADFQEADLQGANLKNANLQGANLRKASLRGVYLRGADLRGASLQGADLQGASLQEADLQGANLRGANLRGANLRGAHLLGSDLQGADLQGTDLRGVVFLGADLRGAIVSTEMRQYLGNQNINI